jgi:uncharacterized protein (TIGR02594 family)
MEQKDCAMNDPSWIAEAKKHIGLLEAQGDANNPEILQMWKDIKRGGIKSDAVPWCSAFCGAMLERAGIKSSRFESAKSYTTWGQPLADPAYGCIVVFERDGGGHVGFVVGAQKDGKLLVLGGNQADAVNVKAFPRDRVIAYRWPDSAPVVLAALPISLADTSVREA